MRPVSKTNPLQLKARTARLSPSRVALVAVNQSGKESPLAETCRSPRSIGVGECFLTQCQRQQLTQQFIVGPTTGLQHRMLMGSPRQLGLPAFSTFSPTRSSMLTSTPRNRMLKSGSVGLLAKAIMKSKSPPRYFCPFEMMAESPTATPVVISCCPMDAGIPSHREEGALPAMDIKLPVILYSDYAKRLRRRNSFGRGAQVLCDCDTYLTVQRRASPVRVKNARLETKRSPRKRKSRSVLVIKTPSPAEPGNFVTSSPKANTEGKRWVGGEELVKKYIGMKQASAGHNSDIAAGLNRRNMHLWNCINPDESGILSRM